MRPKLPEPPLLVVTDQAQAVRPLAEQVEGLLAGGLRWISLREKTLPPEGRRALIETLRPLCRRHDAILGLNGTAEEAAALGLEAVHLADGSSAPAKWDGLLGVSRHASPPVIPAKAGIHVDAGSGPSMDSGFRRNDKAGECGANPFWADYATLSPIFPSPSKPGHGPVLGLGVFAGTQRLLALGGVGPESAAALRRAGAAGLAVMGGAMRADDPQAYARALLQAWDDGAALVRQGRLG